MATSGRLLCVCLVLGLVFGSLGYPVMEKKRAGKNFDLGTIANWAWQIGEKGGEIIDAIGTSNVPCGDGTCQFGCCEDDRCEDLGCDTFSSS
uniref:Teretoxin Tan6.2 n=1 Tax=Terebra anilis TaxID=553697 RepID=T62_TERAN|nr:RecName: Full=Teretoxin Tan6.2; Flags: Precursor [Terebra anilis]